jgi:hypothetical protein
MLQMDKMAYRYGRQMQIYLKSSHRQPITSGIPTCGSGKGLKLLAIKIHTLRNITQNFEFRQITNLKFISVLPKK